MTPADLKAIFASDRVFFESQPDLKEAILFGSALQEAELKDDVDLLVVPSREMSEGEKIDLRQAIWEHFKAKLPVMLEVVTPTVETSKESLAAAGVPTESVFAR